MFLACNQSFASCRVSRSSKNSSWLMLIVPMFNVHRYYTMFSNLPILLFIVPTNWIYKTEEKYQKYENLQQKLDKLKNMNWNTNTLFPGNDSSICFKICKFIVGNVAFFASILCEFINLNFFLLLLWLISWMQMVFWLD